MNSLLRKIGYLVILLGIAACTADPPLPTVMRLPSPIPTQTIVRSAAVIVNTLISTPTPSLTPTIPPSATFTLTASATPTNTATVTATTTATPTATPLPDALVSSAEGVNLRSGPNLAFEPPLYLLAVNTPLKLIAISPNLLWYKVETYDGRQGWAFAKLLTIRYEPPNLPRIDVPLPSPMPAVVTASVGNVISLAPQSVAPGGVGGVGGSEAAGKISARVRQIYQQGLQLGNIPRNVVKVGDSITNNQSFLIGYGSGQYNLGNYGYLQETVNYFNADAFRRDSIAAEAGFNAAAVMDSFLAPAGTCQPNESSLACEYRIMRPSIAIIMFGSVDVQSYDVGAFNNYMNQIVNITTAQGIIPVLTTFPFASNYYPSQSEAFNAVIRSIAANQQLPLIDLQAATVNMPNRGVMGDFFHLTTPGSDWINFTGDENQFASTQRNLLTLQKLDELRRGLGMN